MHFVKSWHLFGHDLTRFSTVFCSVIFIAGIVKTQLDTKIYSSILEIQNSIDFRLPNVRFTRFSQDISVKLKIASSVKAKIVF